MEPVAASDVLASDLIHLSISVHSDSWPFGRDAFERHVAALETQIAAIRKAADTEGLAVLLVEQQARRALSAADRWYLLRNGSIAASGDASSGVGTLEAAYLASMIDSPVAQNGDLGA